MATSTGQPRTLPSTALEFFDESVRRNASAIFTKYFETEMTYGEMDVRSTALAARLRSRGVAAGDRVGIYLQNTPAWCAIALAVWKLGAIVVPVNPMYKVPEVMKIVDDAGLVALFGHPELLDDEMATALQDHGVSSLVSCDPWAPGAEVLGLGFEPFHPQVADIENLADLWAPGDEEFERSPIDGESIAALIYTSGTTGPPKGSMSSHGALSFNTATYRDWMNLDGDDVVLCVAPLFHITGLVGGFLIAALLGSPLVLTYRFDPEMILDVIESTQASFTIASITAFTALMHSPGAAQSDLSSLRTIYSGGAPIMPSTLEGFHSTFGHYIHNIYGLTETNSPTHAVPLGAAAPVDPDTGAISVGQCIFETSMRVIDDTGQELPIGAVGEISVRGPQLFSGYWNKPQETAEVMMDGWFSTGDIGYVDEAGWCYVIDRKKDQINVSGYKVWPREVEDVLTSHPAVLEAAVVGVPDEYRGESVKAYVSLRSGQVSDEASLIEFCKASMAAYKYPRSIEIVSEIPKTATGKILRRALRS